MDDRPEWEIEMERDIDLHGGVVPLFPRHLRTLSATCVHPPSSMEPSSTAALHYALTGHELARGCCSQEQRASLKVTEAP